MILIVWSNGGMILIVWSNGGMILIVWSNGGMILIGKKKNYQSHYRHEVPRGFQEVKAPRLRDNGPGWW